MPQNTSKTYCLLPFIHTYVTASGGMAPCCEAQDDRLAENPASFAQGINSEAYIALRKALLNGERHPICTKCWTNEDQGFLSARQEALLDGERGLFGEFPYQTGDSQGFVDPQLRFLEIKTSNVCNLKCRMCHPESSCRINEDRHIISRYRTINNWPEKPLRSTKFVDMLLRDLPAWAQNLRMVRYSGGEPLIDPDQYRLTRALADFRGSEIELRYATNLTHLRFENQNVLDLWKRFRKVHVKISIDGVDDVYDFIRVGSNFDSVFDNFKKLIAARLPHMDISIGCTVSALNAYQLPELLERFSHFLPDEGIRFFPLHAPGIMSVQCYPEELRRRLIAKLEPYRKFQEFVVALKKPGADEKRWQKLLRYMGELDASYGNKTSLESLIGKYLHVRS